MFVQPVETVAFVEFPVIELVVAPSRAEGFLEFILCASLNQHFLGLQATHQFGDIVGSSLCYSKFAGGDVEQGQPLYSAGCTQSGEEVVLLCCHHVVGQRDAWRYQFCYSALHQFLSELGVFKLVADGHSVARSYEAWEVGIEGVVRKSCHFDSCHAAFVVAVGEGDTEHLCSGDSVFRVGLVEVAASEEHNRVGIFVLQVAELRHHGSELLGHFILKRFDCKISKIL